MNRMNNTPRLRFTSEWPNHQSHEPNWGCGINPKLSFWCWLADCDNSFEYPRSTAKPRRLIQDQGLVRIGTDTCFLTSTVRPLVTGAS